MDASKYIRYACGNCSTSFTPKAATGRPSIYCSIECRPANRAKKPAPTNCKHCNGVIESQRRGKIYCSTTCAVRSRDGSKQTRQEYLEAKRENALANSSAAFNCVECGIRAIRKLGGASKAKGYSNKYCGRGCQLAFNSRLRAEIAVIRAWSASNSKALKKNPKLRKVKVQRESTVPSIVACSQCGKDFCPIATKGNFSRVCSDSCKKARRSEIRRQSHKIARQKYGTSHRKRARRAGVEYESVNRLRVFERDGWRCQICLVRTPKAKMGSMENNAPELDHRTPISKGGGHLYSNTQCACRQCNSIKGNKTNAGQLPMFDA